MTAPRVAASVGELRLLPRRHLPRRGRAPRHRRCRRLPRQRHQGRRLERHLQRGRGHRRGRALDRLGGVPGAGLPVGQHPRAVHGPLARRVQRLDRAGHQPAHPGLRHGRCRLPRRHGAGCRLAHLGARRARSRPTPTSAPVEYITSVLAGRHPRRLAGPRLHPGRPLPVERQEVRRRPGQGHRRPAEPRWTPWPSATATSTSTPRTLVDLSFEHARRAAEGELHPRGRADRPHPCRTRS